MKNIDERREEIPAPPPQRDGNKSSKLKTFLKILLGIFTFVVVTAVGVLVGFVTANINAKPNLAGEIRPPASSQIYDSAGNEIANIHAAENRMPVKIEQIPANLQQAFVAVEDNRFYEHKGVDPKGLLRALYSNITKNEIAEGGSTITQQLAKNAYLTQERTFKRKIQEVFLAIQLEKQYTKQEILELYLNQIYFGQGAYGVQAASKIYFGKNVEDLNLSECALLAGIPKSPNYFSPFNNFQASLDRRNVVIDQMVKYHYINHEEAVAAKTTEIILAQPNVPEEQKDAEAFINYVTQILVERYGADSIYKEGLKIYTTIDMDIQRMAEQVVKDNLPAFYTDANGLEQPQCALVAIDPKTGYIKAMIGGRGQDQFNRATMAERQPGSVFKPFVFAAALEKLNYTPDTYVDDSPININGWRPQNDSGTFSGSVPLRTIATRSLNVPTVKIAKELGMDVPIYYAQEMGITTFVLEGDPNDRNLATALGGLTRGVTPLELTSAYCTFANNGVYVPFVAITKVLDRNGKVLEEAIPEGKVVISAQSAAFLTSMLEDVITRGTGKKAKIDRPAAGKTGTTSNYNDAWFVGYTPDLVAGVWIGNDDNSSLPGIMGGQTPAIMWSDFMKKALANVPAHDFDNLVVQQRQIYVPPTPPRQENYNPQPSYQDDSSQWSNPRQQWQDNSRYEDYAPSYSEPSYSEPSYSEPSYSEPSYSDPQYYDEPAYEEYPEPSYSEPSYSEPQYYDEPAYSEPSYYDDAPSPGDSGGKGIN